MDPGLSIAHPVAGIIDLDVKETPHLRVEEPSFLRHLFPEFEHVRKFRATERESVVLVLVAV